jgi:ABC-type Fe3+ transport system permease subunit
VTGVYLAVLLRRWDFPLRKLCQILVLVPIALPPFFNAGMLILFGATSIHFLFVAIFGRLPRFMGWILTAGYGVFLYEGLLR